MTSRIAVSLTSRISFLALRFDARSASFAKVVYYYVLALSEI